MSQQPNFLFIIADQLRADHLGYNGNPIVRTPHIDALAAAGSRFPRFYVACPVCMPNRASIMTGRLPSLHGVRFNGVHLPADATTFVDLLKAAGYHTGLVGKSHLQNITGLEPALKPTAKSGLVPPPTALRDASKSVPDGRSLEDMTRWHGSAQSRLDGDFYGFSHVEIAAGHADEVQGDYLDWARSRRQDFDALVGLENALGDNRTKAPQAWRTAVPEDLYPTTYVGEQSKAFLTDHAERDPNHPFFLQVSFPDPHHPFTPPGHYWDMYDPEDIPVPESFGKGDLPPVLQLRRELAEGNAARGGQDAFAVTERETREIIALTYGMVTMIDDTVGDLLAHLQSLGLADNTVVVFTSDHGDHMGDHSLMLKLLLHYHGTIHVPFIWHEPGGTGREDWRLASSMDISATILERAGLQPFHGIQGQNLFDPDLNTRSGLLIEEDTQRIVGGFERIQRVRTFVTERHRMSVRHGENWGELFDLQRDPHEIDNLWGRPDCKDLQAGLMEQMVRHMIDHQDQAPLPTGRA